MIEKYAIFFLIAAWLFLTCESVVYKTYLNSDISPRSSNIAMNKLYQSLLRRIYNENIIHPVKMGLENSKTIYKALGKPLDKMHVIHVAGTNGKGSVCWKAANYLHKGGLSTGLFVSPHISSFRERVQVNGNILSIEDVVELLPQIFEICDQHKIPATFFELTTALAMLRFQTARCEAVVLEVGLGGRLDATNVVTPSLCVITSIGLDHLKILGETIEQIAMEKAGIMKPGIPVLVGPQCPVELLRGEAARVGAPFFTLSDLLSSKERRCHPRDASAPPDIDDLNADITEAALRLLLQKNDYSLQTGVSFSISKEDSEESLMNRPPCRFEIRSQLVTLGTRQTPSDTSVDPASATVIENVQTVQVDVVLDIAHNFESIQALVRKMNKYFYGRSVRVVLGMSADKDVNTCLDIILKNLASPVKIHCVKAAHPRAISVSSLRSLIHQRAHGGVLVDAEVIPVPGYLDSTQDGTDGDIREGVRNALQAAATDESTSVVLVFGSFFIMSEVRAELGIIEEKDGDILYVPGSSNKMRDAQEII
mmetsp:Transcript_11756/g.11825  ORF Transcript_11756/g.11825 Transcript_11756/m.11825 type:complete len:538 (+) Transcript_11756:107-1720(+)